MAGIVKYRPRNQSRDVTVDEDRPLPVTVIADVQSARVQSKIPAPVVVSASVATLIAPANPSRRSLMLTQVTGTQIVYLHIDNLVTSTRYGTVLTAAVGGSLTLFTKDAIWGISASSAQTVGVWDEEYTSA